MQFNDLKIKIGLNNAVLLKWENKNFSESCLNGVGIDELLELYSFSKRQKFPEDLQKIIFENISRQKLETEKWMRIYKSNSDEIEALACDKIHSQVKNFNDWRALAKRMETTFSDYNDSQYFKKSKALISAGYRKTAETFEDWQIVYEYMEVDDDFGNQICKKLVESAKCFDHWAFIHKQGFVEYFALSWRKMCELEKAEQ